MDSAQNFGQPPSGLPPLAFLSGLNLGQGGMSGAGDPSLSGSGQAGAGVGAGASGGLGLDELTQLLMAQQSADSVGSAGTPFTQGIGDLGGFGNLGQGPGYGQAGGVLSQSQPAQQQQQGAGAVAGQSAGGGIDPMAILRQALGLAQKGVGLFGGNPGYSTIGDTGGVSLSDQLRSGEAGIASPIVDPNAPGVPPGSGFQDPNALGGLLSGGGYGSPGAVNQTYINQLGGGNTASQEFINAALQAGMTPDQIVALQSDPEVFARLGGTVGTPDTGTASPTNSLSGVSDSGSGMNLTGAAGSALGAGGSLLGLIQAIQSGNYGQLPSSLYGLYQGGAGLINNLGGSVPQITGNAVDLAGSGGLTAAGIVNAIPGIIDMLGGGHAGPELRTITQPIADTAKLLAAQSMAAASAATGSIPYAAIVAQAISDAMSIYGVASGQQDLKSAVLGAIPFIGSYLQALEHQMDENPGGWATIGKAATQLGEGAYRSGTQANQLFDQVKQAGLTDPSALEQMLGIGANALFPFYESVQGPAAPINAGMWADRIGRSNPDLNQAYQTTQTNLQNNLWDTILQLNKAGVSAQQLGQLPVNPLWGDSYLGGDAAHRAYTSAQATPENATALGGQGGIVVPGSWLSNPGMASLGLMGNFLSPTATNVATGGPINSMIAALNPALYGQIGGGFDFSAPAVQGELQPILQNIAMINQAANEAFTSGGG